MVSLLTYVYLQPTDTVLERWIQQTQIGSSQVWKDRATSPQYNVNHSSLNESIQWNRQNVKVDAKLNKFTQHSKSTHLRAKTQLLRHVTKFVKCLELIGTDGRLVGTYRLQKVINRDRPRSDLCITCNIFHSRVLKYVPVSIFIPRFIRIKCSRLKR